MSKYADHIEQLQKQLQNSSNLGDQLVEIESQLKCSNEKCDSLAIQLVNCEKIIEEMNEEKDVFNSSVQDLNITINSRVSTQCNSISHVVVLQTYDEI